MPKIPESKRENRIDLGTSKLLKLQKNNDCIVLANQNQELAPVPEEPLSIDQNHLAVLDN